MSDFPVSSTVETPNPHPFTEARVPGQTPYHLCAETPQIIEERARIYEAYARTARRELPNNTPKASTKQPYIPGVYNPETN